MRPLPEQFTAATPVERHGGFLVKRDDELVVHGVRGGKVRAAAAILCRRQEGVGIVGFGGRRSNTAAAMAAAGRLLGRPVTFHTATGPATEEMERAEELGAEVTRHRPGYMSLLESRARADSLVRQWPLGLKHGPAVEAMSFQVSNLVPHTFRRVVVVVGAGVTLAGVARGLREARLPQPILGVLVGADPDRAFLDLWEPLWRKRVELVRSSLTYDRPHPNPQLGELPLDPFYEAKAMDFLHEEDLLWVAGRR